MEVNDIYEAMETITKVYGFAGLEPNSVMFGWARDSKDRIAFSKLLRTYQKLDYNIFVLDYNKEIGFGKNKTIDLWWRGSGNNATLALTLIKFLQMEDDWSNVTARIFIITDDSSIHNRVYRNISQILDDHRISATFRLINNSIDNKPFDEIILLESKDTDLVILGLPPIQKEEDIIEKTDKIIKSLNTVLLIHASSFFNPLYIGLENVQVIDEKIERIESEKIAASIKAPQNDILANATINLFEGIEKTYTTFQNEYLSKISLRNQKVVEGYYDLTERTLNEFDLIVTPDSKQKGIKLTSKLISNYLYNSRSIVEDFKTKTIPLQSELLLFGMDNYQSQFKAVYEGLSEALFYTKKNEKPAEENVILKLFEKIGIRKTERKIKVKFKDLVQAYSKYLEKDVFYQLISGFTFSNYQFISKWQKINNFINDSLKKIEGLAEKGEIGIADLENEKGRIKEKFLSLAEDYKNNNNKLFNKQKIDLKNYLEKFSEDIQDEKVNRIVNQKKREIKKLKIDNLNLLEIPKSFERNENLIANFFVQDLYLLKVLKTELKKFLIEIFKIYQFSWRTIILIP